LAAAAGPLAIAEANFAQAGRAYDAAIEARTAAGTAQAGAPGAVIAAEAIVNTARTARDEAQEALYTKTRELTGLQGADEPDQTAIATKQREVNTAQGELTTAQLNLSQAETGLTQARATIGAAGTAWTAADAEVARTRNERDRLEVIRDAAQKTFDDLEVELKRLKEPQG
jgi:chromosome segregation ATPase